MPRKTKARTAALQPIENEQPTTQEDDGINAVLDVKEIINNIEAQVEERISAIISAADDAIVSLRNDLKTKIVRLPKSTRDMKLTEFQEKYPEDFKTGALLEIRQRYAAMAEAAQQPVPTTTSKRTRTGIKRAAEPPTVLQTVKTRRTVSGLPRGVNQQPVAPSGLLQNNNYDNHNNNDNDIAVPIAPPRQDFNGVPLQTPIPFTGSAMPLPITMLAQKRGGRTRAMPAPEAAVITTADGMQWALGKDGLQSIPESHRAEVSEMLSAQFNFLAAALGKTVFDRNGKK